MGRPIKKKWFRARDLGSNADLTVTTQSGNEPIIRQRGTGKYAVASGVVKLVDGAPGAPDECQLQHEGKNVRKITQYKVYYFDGSVPAVWRDKDSNIVGTFTPALTAEDLLDLATATASISNSAISGYTITNGGASYVGAPAVTVSAPDGTSATATVSFANGLINDYSISDSGDGYSSVPSLTIGAPDGTTATATANIANGLITGYTVTGGGGGYLGSNTTATVGAPDGTSASMAGTVAITGGAPQPPDADQSAMIAGGGTGYNVAPVVTQTGGTGTGSVFTAVLTNGVVTSITATAGNSDYAGDETLSIAAVVLTQETTTVTVANGVVTLIVADGAGEGYASAPTVTVAAVTLTQATATAVLDSGIVDTIIINNAGAGYASVPTVTIAAVTLTQETATATLTGDAVTSIATNAAGVGYVSVTVTIAGP